MKFLKLFLTYFLLSISLTAFTASTNNKSLTILEDDAAIKQLFPNDVFKELTLTILVRGQSVCPPCPAGAMCAPCNMPSIQGEVEAGEMPKGSSINIITTINMSQLTVGNKYLMRILKDQNNNQYYLAGFAACQPCSPGVTCVACD